jgi:transposase
MEHDVNPNQLRKWITRYRQQQLEPAQQNSTSGVTDGVLIDTPTPVHQSGAPAFIPGVLAPLTPPAVSHGAPESLPLTVVALHVRLPNGAEFEFGNASLEELTTIVQMLGSAVAQRDLQRFAHIASRGALQVILRRPQLAI